MKYTLLLLTLILTTVQANLGTFKGERLINPDTNQPYTGNLEVLNKDWGNDVVEFSKDYVDGVSLEQELLDNKLAYEYSGGKKLSWCK